MSIFHSNKAFTLVELLVVISIIGVLSSVVFASLSSARTKAKQAKIIQMMMVVNDVAHNCLNGGVALNIPASDALGGGNVCNGDVAVLPNITDTGFRYCGVACGGWTSDISVPRYAISVFDGVNRYIVCGLGYNASGWYIGNAEWDFTSKSGCVTKGF